MNDKTKPSVWLTCLTFVVIVFIGWYAGWFAGSSRTPIAGTVVPLLFGLLTAFLLKEPTLTKALAIPVFVFCFMIGYDYGEHVDEPLTVQDVLVLGDKLVVSDAVFDELTLLQVQLTKTSLNNRQQKEIMFGVAKRIAMDTSLAEDKQLEKLRTYRSELSR